MPKEFEKCQMHFQSWCFDNWRAKRNNAHYVGLYKLSILMNWKVFTLDSHKGAFFKSNIDSTDLNSKRTKKNMLYFSYDLCLDNFVFLQSKAFQLRCLISE